MKHAYGLIANPEVLDYSAGSLVPLWEWYTKKIKVVSKSQEEIHEINQLPKWLSDHTKDWKLITETVILALDVSLYFAEVLLRKYPKLEW